MTEHNADQAAKDFRSAMPADLREAARREPEEFGLRFLTIDELIAKAEASQGQAEDQLLRRRATRRRLATGAGLAAAAVVTAAVVIPAGSGPQDHGEAHEPGGGRPSIAATPDPVTYGTAREVLLAASRVEGQSTAQAKYWHVRSIQVFGTERVPREIWLGNGRPSILRQDGIVDRLPAAAFPAAGEAIGWNALQSLPTSASKLRALLVSGNSSTGRDTRWVLFKAAGQLVAEAPLPPAVRSALWQVLASVPGAQRTRQTKDDAGRVAWTVSMTLPGEGKLTYLVDPVSGQLLEERHVPGGGRVPWHITFLERGPASDAPALGRT